MACGVCRLFGTWVE